MRDSNKTLLIKEILEHTVHIHTFISLTPTPHHTNIYTTHPLHPPHTGTHYQRHHTSNNAVGLKGKVKVRMMRNKTSYRRLTSIYIEYKGQKNKYIEQK